MGESPSFHTKAGPYRIVVADLTGPGIAALLEPHGAVLPRVARQMARGVRDVLGRDGAPADVGIATTGVAGPEPQDGQPVGTVHIAVSTPLGTRVDSLVIAGDRDRIRREATHIAIRRALAAL